MRVPDLVTLRLFLTVHELGNVTRAGQRHNIAASSVTKRLQDLEAHYKVRLFDRLARGVVPTSAGDELARHVQGLFAQIEDIQGTMGEFVEGIRGNVRVHSSASIIMDYLADDIAKFVGRNPLVRIELQEATSWLVVRNVFEGRADIGLVASSVEIPSDLTVHPYRTDQLVAVVSPTHPLAASTAIDFEWLLDYEHVGIGVTAAVSMQLADEAARLNRAIRHSYRVETVDVARRMVAAGLGVAVLPDGMVIPYQEAVGIRAIPLRDAWARRAKRICVRSSSLTASARLFLAHVQQT
jgi:DNA-binding transcriptional LysR family regulator